MQLRIPVRVFGAEWTLRRRGPQAKHPLTVQNLFRRADEDIGPYENAGSIRAGGHMGPPLQAVEVYVKRQKSIPPLRLISEGGLI